MNRPALALPFLALIAFTAPAGGQTSGELRFRLSHIDASQGGHIRCALYSDSDTWLEHSRSMRQATVAANRSTATCVFANVPAGRYALAALHDADDDREMDRNMFGIPEEGYAISNDAADGMSPPDFGQATIRFDGTRTTTRARMNY